MEKKMTKPMTKKQFEKTALDRKMDKKELGKINKERKKGKRPSTRKTKA